jgi:hypothetical protein
MKLFFVLISILLHIAITNSQNSADPHDMPRNKEIVTELIFLGDTDDESFINSFIENSVIFKDISQERSCKFFDIETIREGVPRLVEVITAKIDWNNMDEILSLFGQLGSVYDRMVGQLDDVTGKCRKVAKEMLAKNEELQEIFEKGNDDPLKRFTRMGYFFGKHSTEIKNRIEDAGFSVDAGDSDEAGRLFGDIFFDILGWEFYDNK